jgi:pyruvate/2-oxoglutarate dehydrogenase complex dihydrolipoamide dehydrogenase (E3) component
MGIDLHQNRARFISEGEIVVGGEVLSADRFVIATGSTATIPEIDGLDEVGYLTHRDLTSLDELPASLLIIGGDGIAVELAQMFLSFGVDVTLVTADDRILPREDPDVVEALTEVLERENLVLCPDAFVASIQRGNDGSVLLTVDGPDGNAEVFEADEVLVASGREPCVLDLGLDEAGVGHSAKGVHVDATMRTSVPHIYAVGDVTGIYAYTHVAGYQGRVALHNLLHPGSTRRADYRVVPWKVFTQPELARVGLTENEAHAGGYDVVTSTMPFRDLPHALTLDEGDGLVKLVVDRSTHEILGGHVLGAHASEVIAEIAVVMQHRLPVSAISDTIHTHATMSEGVFLAAQELMRGALQATTPVR